MKVSVLLIAYNEEKNLPRCLDALGWCDDIVVVDSGSIDKSVDLVQAAGGRVYYRRFDDFAHQRNFGLDEVDFKHEWILHLDADEVATAKFTQALNNLEPSQGIYAYLVPSKTMLNGRWLKNAGMYPSYQVRLGHRDKLRFKQVGHGQREDLPPEQVGIFPEPYLHFNFSQGVAAWLGKHVRYAEDEARVLLRSDSGEDHVTVHSQVSRRRWAKRLANRLPLLSRPFARFFYVYIWRRGFMDGSSGLLYATMLATYEAMIAVIAMSGRSELNSGPEEYRDI